MNSHLIGVKRLVAAVLLPCACATLPHPPAAASDYPSKPVRVVVPFPPGGINDLLARLLGARLSERSGQQFVIDNRAGANTIVGTDLTAKSPPDGYTIMIVPGGHAINPSVYRQLPYDTLKDFRGVTFIGHSPYVLAVHPGLRVKNVAELIELAKRKPDQISFSSSGIGNITHLAAELMNDIAGTKLVHVPYKGTGQLIADLMGGSVPVSIISFSSGRNYVKSGKIVVLGVTTAKRNPVMPDLPTLAESGLAGYEVSGWYAFLAPAGTPVSVVDKLNAAIKAALAMPDIRERVVDQGVDITEMTPTGLDAHIRSEVSKWRKLVARLGIAEEWNAKGQ